MRKILGIVLAFVFLFSPFTSNANPALEFDIKAQLRTSLDKHWKIVTVSIIDGVRIHICIRDTVNGEWSPEWKNKSPHTDISQKCANIAFSCAESYGGGYWVSVAVKSKTGSWESYQWRESMYKDGSVITNGWLNEF